MSQGDDQGDLDMPQHFNAAEYTRRQADAVHALQREGLDGILLFAPESQFWLSGYDTFGFAMFQCLILTATGEMHLLTRMPDLRQAQLTSVLPDECIHIWPETEGANPADDLAKLIATLGLTGKKLGYESKTVGLTAFNGARVAQALPGLIEASHLIADLRRVKSKAELDMIARAAALSDAALDAGKALIKPGAFEGDILAAMQGAVFQGGGDYAGNEIVIGSGDKALLCRYFSGRRHLDTTDQLTLEWSGAYARYHAAMMRTVVIGPPNDAQKRLHAVAEEALVACEAAIKPGAPMADVYQAHAKVYDAAGLSHARLQACGYGMGIAYTPIWVEFPMFYEGNPMIMRENQAFFLHMIAMDSDAGLAMTLGHTVQVTATGAQRLSRHGTGLMTA